MEVRRKINKQNLKFDQNKKHLKDLHNLDKTRRKERENKFEQKKTQEEEEYKNFDYKPQLDKNSEKLMEKRETGLFDRQ